MVIFTIDINHHQKHKYQIDLHHFIHIFLVNFSIFIINYRIYQFQYLYHMKI